MPHVRKGLVSVILVNYKGATDTIEALGHLRQLNWPAEDLEIIVVDNASGDDSVARLKAADPHATIIRSATNSGFAGGCNQGVKASSGEYLAFLNNDARPDANWIRAAVARFRSSSRIGAVASKVLDWEGNNVDFVGAGLTWYGMGYKPFTSEPAPKDPAVPADVLFGTGSAMFVRRSVYLELGGFDERYFMFFEDVDFGWRLNLLGWRFAYEPKSLAFHKHHASMKSFGQFKEQYLLERNALYTLYKNFSQTTLDRVLPAAMALSMRRGIAKAGLDNDSLDLRRGGGDKDEDESVSKQLLSSAYAIDQFVENLPSLAESREKIQASRTVSDQRLWRLFGDTDFPAYQARHYLDGYANIVDAFGVGGEPPSQTKVLVITGDPIGPKIAGPAIRAWNIANALAYNNSVKLVTMSGVEPVDAPFDILHVTAGNDREFAKYERWADIVIFQGHALSAFESLQRSKKILVVDIYDPMHLEQLEQGRDLPMAQWEAQVSDATEVLNEQLVRGDFFLCASERQKHFYLGQLAALGRLSPSTYEGDPDFDNLISVVPFGTPSDPPVHERDVLKGVRAGFGTDDKVLLWSGGVYNWFDPKTLIRAVAALEARRGGVRLFFQGTKHPHPGVPEMEVVADSRELAATLGVLDQSVFFNDSWVDYADRQNYLLEADAGVSTHYSHVETTFSFRTRILDYLWAELPMVVTEGDHFADLVRAEGMGIVVPAQDVDALTDALEKILFDPKFAAAAKANIARVRQWYTWDVVLAPLVDFVADAHHAADFRMPKSGKVKSDEKPAKKPRKRAGFRHDLRQSVHYLQNGGPRVVFGKVRTRFRRAT
jgi:GT2 family glycosyltransferase/glycosyltransferase involved in cell wall biosynthesis